jgi:hypothetical protein
MKGLMFTEGLVQHTPMFIGWLTCIPAVLLPHSLYRFTTANAPANRQMPIASVVRWHSKKKKGQIYGWKIFDELSASSRLFDYDT